MSHSSLITVRAHKSSKPSKIDQGISKSSNWVNWLLSASWAMGNSNPALSSALFFHLRSSSFNSAPRIRRICGQSALAAVLEPCRRHLCMQADSGHASMLFWIVHVHEILLKWSWMKIQRYQSFIGHNWNFQCCGLPKQPQKHCIHTAVHLR